jgi:exodeoxyribonuclease VII large subunit
MDEKNIFTVKQINSLSSQILRETFSNIYIRGEISGLSHRDERWTFFDLKDEDSIIKCVNFSGSIYKYKDILSDGMEIIVNGYLNVYEKRGTYQCNIEDIIVLGNGEIYQKIEEIKAKLLKEGLFNEENKKSLGYIPESVGVITSLEDSSMAYKDFIKTLHQRFPPIDIYLYDAKVQGINAEKTIIEGIKYFNNQDNIDLIVITRGGGSIEDLMPFNSEELVREIYKSKKIIVSAIGHEGNTSISDLVSDIYAFTPTHAATLIVPDHNELYNYFNKTLMKIVQNSELIIDSKIYYLESNYNSIKQISEYRIEQKIQFLKEGLFMLKEKALSILSLKENFDYKMKAILDKVKNREENKKNELKGKMKLIESYNPINLLSKGYSIVYKNGKILKDIESLNINDIIKIRLSKGTLKSKIIGKNE